VAEIWPLRRNCGKSSKITGPVTWGDVLGAAHLLRRGLDDEARRDPDAIEAVFRKLKAADEAEAARRNLYG
jgi:hypothetical protein